MKEKIYEPVREFERQTSYCPLYLAWRIVDEARDYFRHHKSLPSSGCATFSHLMGEGLADKLARRAEAVFAHQPFWQRKYQSARGREFILMSMRHWLAGSWPGNDRPCSASCQKASRSVWNCRRRHNL